MAKVQRWEIPVDGKVYELTFKGLLADDIFFLAATKDKPARIEVWTFEYLTPFDPAVPLTHKYRVFPLDAEIPASHVLCAIVKAPGLLPISDPVVYHLFEKMV